MKPKTIIIVCISIVLIALIKLFFIMPEQGKMDKNKAKNSTSTTVRGYVIKTELLENKIYSSGTLHANEEVALSPETAGKLIAIYFKEGSEVNKGDLLAKINDTELQAQLNKLKFQLKLAQEKEQRLKALLEINGISQEDYNESANAVQSLKTDIDFTKALIAKTEIRAPFDGSIGLKNYSEGSFVNTGSIIAKIEQSKWLKLDFNIPEKYASFVKKGDSVLFSLSNQTEKHLASVTAIEPKIDEKTRQVQIRAEFDNSKTNLFAGSFASICLILSKKNDAILIPSEAIIPEAKGKKVFICNHGKAIPTKVITGIRTDKKVEIMEGLKVGDTLITSGIMTLKPNSDVKIIDFK